MRAIASFTVDSFSDVPPTSGKVLRLTRTLDSRRRSAATPSGLFGDTLDKATHNQPIYRHP